MAIKLLNTANQHYTLQPNAYLFDSQCDFEEEKSEFESKFLPFI